MTADPRQPETGETQLNAVLLASDALTVSPSGLLEIAGRTAAGLVAEFGSPLNVIAEQTVRSNYRRIRDSFAANWPAPVRILYSIKANNTIAIRAILSEEGAGGDCFGLGELHATLAGGADPALVVMNGSNKSGAEIGAAIDAGLTINIDSDDEIGLIAAACRTGAQVRVNLRLKVFPAELDAYVTPLHPTAGGYAAGVRRVKWGYTVDAAIPLIARLRAMPGVTLLGYSCHIGHLSSQPAAFAAVATAIGGAVTTLHAATGFVPAVLDIGGGWAPERDPSFRQPGVTGTPIETVVQTATAALLAALPPRMPVPDLWAEPGRFIVSNAVVLLATAGAVKRDAGYCWMHVDASTNNLPRIESGQFHYTILPASRMREPANDTMEVVGSTCFRSVLGAGRALPPPARGDIIAILDAGMYAEVFANQFNAVPRPATVLLSAHGADLVRARETIADLFAQQRLPARLEGRVA
jgi:diaminopimelate decarboxylase